VLPRQRCYVLTALRGKGKVAKFRRSPAATVPEPGAVEEDYISSEDDPSIYYSSPPPEVYDRARTVVLDTLLHAQLASNKSPDDLIGKVADGAGVSPHEARRTIAELIVRGEVIREGLENLVVSPEVISELSDA
jgi:hypothetical protein